MNEAKMEEKMEDTMKRPSEKLKVAIWVKIIKTSQDSEAIQQAMSRLALHLFNKN